MASTSEKVLQLRELLAGRLGKPDLGEKITYLTGLPALDQIEIPQAAITEIVSDPAVGPGGALLLYGLLHCTLKKGDRVALIDANDSFQPKALPMNPIERLQADYDGTRVTTGPHPMSFVRSQLCHVTRASDLINCKHGQRVSIAGVVICRQRPGTAKGHVFVSLEDESGIANAIVRSELFEKLRLTITHEPLLEIHGQLQHVDGVVSVLAKDVRGLNAPATIDGQSYDFH